MTSSVYDPLGFAAPAILPAKQLLQILCQENLSWDDPIPDRLQRKWEQWLLHDFPKLENMKIERCYKPKNFGAVTSCQLHLFSYSLIMTLAMESRVAPLTKISVPRMELTAATVAAPMSKMIARELANKNWIKGPDYLWKSEMMWPQENVQTMIPEYDPEIKKPTVNCAIEMESRINC